LSQPATNAWEIEPWDVAFLDQLNDFLDAGDDEVWVRWISKVVLGWDRDKPWMDESIWTVTGSTELLAE